MLFDLAIADIHEDLNHIVARHFLIILFRALAWPSRNTRSMLTATANNAAGRALAGVRNGHWGAYARQWPKVTAPAAATATFPQTRIKSQMNRLTAKRTVMVAEISSRFL